MKFAAFVVELCDTNPSWFTLPWELSVLRHSRLVFLNDLKNLWLFFFVFSCAFFRLDIIPLTKAILKEIPLFFQAMSAELCFIAVRMHHRTVERQLDAFSKLY